MRVQHGLTRAAVLAYAARGDFRYESSKWSVRQIIGHMSDTERVFGFRALWMAKADPSPLPGFEQGDWMGPPAPSLSRWRCY